jgi:protein phosphatase
VELTAQTWGPALLGAVLLCLLWALGRRRGASSDKRAKSSASARDAAESSAAAKAKEPAAKAAASLRPAKPKASNGANASAPQKTAPSSTKASPNAAVAEALGIRAADPASDDGPRAPKAIVWQPPASDRFDDDDITVVHVIPFIDAGAEITVEAPPAAAPTTSEDDQSDEERVSRVDVSYEEGAEPDEVTGTSARILLWAGGDSDRGRVRKRNEDSHLVMPEQSLFAVADGMGGHQGGEIASSIAIDTLRDAFARSDFESHVEGADDAPKRAKELAAAVQLTNECVRSMALADRELSNMGTTLVAARFSPNKQRLYIGNVGDSRCYRLRRGVFRQLTTDHTMASLGMQGPHAKDLYQAIGVSPGVTIDLIVDKPQEDDIYLLCSDGLSKMVSDDEIRQVLIDKPDLDDALYTLIETANDHGGNDNVTVIIVKVLVHDIKALAKAAADAAARRTDA